MKKAIMMLAILCSAVAFAQRPAQKAEEANVPVNEVFDSWTAPDVSLSQYFATSTAEPASPDAKGFIRRWTLLEPIAKPEIRSNSIFTDSWLREEIGKQLFASEQAAVQAVPVAAAALDEGLRGLRIFVCVADFEMVALFRLAGHLGGQLEEHFVHTSGLLLEPCVQILVRVLFGQVLDVTWLLYFWRLLCFGLHNFSVF